MNKIYSIEKRYLTEGNNYPFLKIAEINESEITRNESD